MIHIVRDTPQEQRKAERYWEAVQQEAVSIRDACEQEEGLRQRRKVGGTSAYADSIILFFGYTKG